VKKCLGLHGRGFESRGGRFSHGTHARRDWLYCYTALLTNYWKLNTEWLVGSNTFLVFFCFSLLLFFSRTHGATRVTKSLTNPASPGVGQIGHLKQKSGHQLRCSAFSSECTLLAYYPDNGTTDRLVRQEKSYLCFEVRSACLQYSNLQTCPLRCLIYVFGPNDEWLDGIVAGWKETHRQLWTGMTAPRLPSVDVT
jgi:hypothetical protein